MEINGNRYLLTGVYPPDRRAVGQNTSSLPVPLNRSGNGDTVSLSGTGRDTSQTRLISENIEETDFGLRRTQTFERPDGRTFSRTEDITTTDRGTRRNVIQQNPSGSTIFFEEVLDRQPDGGFRRTQRFTNEAGETITDIRPGATAADSFIVGSGYGGGRASNLPLFPLRGTQVDLQI